MMQEDLYANNKIYFRMCHFCHLLLFCAVPFTDRQFCEDYFQFVHQIKKLFSDHSLVD